VLLFCRKQIPILLGMLLTFTFVVNGFAGQWNASSSVKDLQLHQDMQFVLSSPVLEFKFGARKETSSCDACVIWAATHGPELNLGCPSSQLEGEAAVQIALSDLQAVRGRAPPVEGVC